MGEARTRWDRAPPRWDLGTPSVDEFVSGMRTELRGLVRRAIAERMFPGAVVYVSRGGRTVWHEAFGRTTYDAAGSRPVRLGDLFDLASLTKLYTTALVLRLVERGALRLNDAVRAHVPQVRAGWTVEDLLAHRTGTTDDLLGWAVRRGIRPCEPGQEDALWSVIFQCEAKVPLAPGQSRYSDVDLLLAGRVCERVAAARLAELMATEVFAPVGLGRTGFRPPDPGQCVPTEIDDRWRHRLVVGEVHDEMAATLGGVAGHAGLFSTAAEVGRFCEAWLGLGQTDLLGEDMRALAMRPHSDNFGLGWRLCNASFFPSLQPAGAVGHLGFTGTSALLFPAAETVFVLLSNRVCPTRDAAPSRLPLLTHIAERIAALPEDIIENVDRGKGG